MRLRWRPFRLRLSQPLRTARGPLLEKRGWLLRLETADGAVGWGEAAPLELGGPQAWQALAAALRALQASLGPVVRRGELESWLASPACPPSLGFALGGALAEADGRVVLGQGAAAGSLLAAGPRADAGQGAAAGCLTAGGYGAAAAAAGPVAAAGWRSAPVAAPVADPVAVPVSASVAVPVAALVSAQLLPAGAAALPALTRLLSSASTGSPAVASVPVPLTLKWKVAVEPDALERDVLEQLLQTLAGDGRFGRVRLRLDANGGWDRACAWAWAERLSAEPRLDWLEQPLPADDLSGLADLARRYPAVPIALDETLQRHPQLRSSWTGWQVRRPSQEGDPRPLLAALERGQPRLMLSTAFETGIGRRWLTYLAALQLAGPTPAAPGLAPGWQVEGGLGAADPAAVWQAAGCQAPGREMARWETASDDP